MKTIIYISALVASSVLPVRSVAHEIKDSVDARIERVRDLEDQGNYQSALDVSTKTLQMLQASGESYPEGAGNCLLEMGLCNMHLGAIEKSITLFESSLQIRTALHDTTGMASVYNNLSTALLELHRYGQAKSNSLRAIGLYSLDNRVDSSGLIRAYHNYANILIEGENLIDSSIYYNRESVRLWHLSGNQDTSSIINAYYGIGEAYLKKNYFDSAATYFNKVRTLAAITQNNAKLGITHEGLGLVEMARQNWESAKTQLDTAKSLLEMTQDSLGLINVYFNLGILHTSMEQFDDAQGDFTKAASLLKDKIVPGDNLRASIDKQKTLNAVSQRKYWIKLIAGAILLVALLTLAFVFYKYVTAKAQNIVLKERVVDEMKHSVEIQAQLNKNEELRLIQKNEILRMQTEAVRSREEAAKKQEEINRLVSLQHWAIKGTFATVLAHLNTKESAFRIVS
jgi:tetratricopeptide (TPR) repeat protein